MTYCEKCGREAKIYIKAGIPVCSECWRMINTPIFRISTIKTGKDVAMPIPEELKRAVNIDDENIPIEILRIQDSMLIRRADIGNEKKQQEVNRDE